MSKLYIPPPTVEEMMWSYAKFFARIFRVEITYRITHINGNYECIEIANPDGRRGE